MSMRVRPGRVNVMVRIMIIVARDRPKLYDYFREAFAGVDHVEVIMDRRLPVSSAPAAHGQRERRQRPAEPDIYDELMLQGFVIKRLQE
jgi:hypothetical protein